MRMTGLLLTLAIFTILTVVPAILSWEVCLWRRQNPWYGLLAGVFLSWLGWLLIWLLLKPSED